MTARAPDFRKTRSQWGLLALLPLALGATGPCMPAPANSNSAPDSDSRLAIAPDDHVRGDAQAPVVVIEYADLQCAVCGRFAREVFPTIEAEYVDTGKVAWVTRHFPLTDFHPDAERTARAAECAGDQRKFDAFVDLVLSDQSDLSEDGLRTRAESLALDLDAFDTCLGSDDVATRVADDLAEGVALGVSATPTFFIDGEMVIGFRSIAEFRGLLDAALQ